MAEGRLIMRTSQQGLWPVSGEGMGDVEGFQARLSLRVVCAQIVWNLRLRQLVALWAYLQMHSSYGCGLTVDHMS